jgi:predicted DNA-binding transcriptional regulator AlpA
MVGLVPAGKLIGIARDTSYRLYRAGEFPVRVERIGNKLLVRRSDLIEYLSAAS